MENKELKESLLPPVFYLIEMSDFSAQEICRRSGVKPSYYRQVKHSYLNEDLPERPMSAEKIAALRETLRMMIVRHVNEYEEVFGEPITKAVEAEVEA